MREIDTPLIATNTGSRYVRKKTAPLLRATCRVELKMQVRYLTDDRKVFVGQVIATNAVLRFAVVCAGPAKFRDILDIEECNWDGKRKLIVCTRVAQWPEAQQMLTLQPRKRVRME